MTCTIESLAEHYSEKYEGLASSWDVELPAIYSQYTEARETSLLDAVAATGAINAFFESDKINSSAIDPQMLEAANLQWGDDKDSLLERLQGLGDKSSKGDQLTQSQWKGKYFEVIVRDKLNAGELVGDLRLANGQMAELAESLTQPGWDLQIISADGSVAEELQLKASDSLGYVKEAVERYPDIPIIATDEVADKAADDLISGSGILNADLDATIDAPLEDLLDSPLEEFIETIAPGLPFVLIATTEGARALVSKSTLRAAVDRSLERSIKTGASLGVGGVLALVDAGVISLPATFMTRLSIDWYRVQNGLLRRLQADIDLFRGLGTEIEITAGGKTA